MKKVKRFIAVMVSTVMLLMLVAYFPVSAYPSAYPVPSLTGNQREDIVNIALSQKGYKQNGGTVYGAWYDSIKGTNFTNSAWCAMFVSWCANQAGIDQNVLTYRSFVPDMVSDFKSKGQWHDRNYTPSRGDIIIVNSSGHVGIVTGVSGNTVYTIEGNKSSLGNACGTGSYQIGSSYITGYGVPNYGSSSAPSWAWISATDDRTSFAVGEEIHFWMSADESNGTITHYFIGINKGDERIITEKCNGDFYVSFNEPGNYSVYVSAYNDTGLWADSNIIYFTIKNKPSWAWISATGDRTTFSVGEEIVFTMSADESYCPINYYFIGINKGDERIITERCYGEYNVSFDEPGDYSVYVSAYNDAGWADSNIINFKVVRLKDLPGSPLEFRDVGTDFYAIISQVSTKQLLTNKDEDAIFSPYSGKMNQYWYFSYNDNGSYTIESYDRTQALDVTRGSIENGTNVRLYKKNGSIEQQWYLYWADGGIYFKSALGNCVLDFNGSSGNGANADLWQFDGTIAQVMEFYSISLDGEMPLDMGECFFAKIVNTATGKALSNINNTNLACEDSEYKEEQTWYFIRNDNGSYKIISYADVERSISIDDFGNANGTNISIDIDNDNIAQRFFLYEIDGNIYIKPLCSDRVFDMNTNTFNIEAWGYIKGADCKRFSIEKINENKIVNIEIAQKPTKLTYNVGDKLDTSGLVIKQIYETGSTFTTSSGFSVDKNVLKLGDNEVTVTYEGKTAKFNITVTGSKADLNQDGSVTILDAVLLQKHLLNFKKLTAEQLKLADINSDGRVNILDMSLLKEKLK